MRGSHEPQPQGLGIQDPAQTTPRASQRLSQLQFPLPTFVTTSPTSPPADGTVRAPRGHDNTRVLDRISALLHKEEPQPEHSLQVPAANTPTSEPSAESFEIEFQDRPAIKVLVVTWNMGDALPKGDLSVLLGEIPPYEPAEKTDDLPELPVENKHPYHIVVVAAQECPTPSGVPRGLGAGLRKGVIPKVEGLRGREPSVALKKEERDAVLKEIRDRGKDRVKAATDWKDKDTTPTKASPVDVKDGKDKLSNSPNGKERSVSAEEKGGKESKSESKDTNGSAHKERDPESARSPKLSPTLNKDKELMREMQAPFHTSLDRALDKAIDRVERPKDTIDVSLRTGENPSRTRTPNGDDVLSPDEDAAGTLKASAPKGWSSMLEVPCETPLSTPQSSAGTQVPAPPAVATPSAHPMSPVSESEDLLDREASPTPRQTPLPSSSSSSSASTARLSERPPSIAVPGSSSNTTPRPQLLHPTPRSHLGSSYDSNKRLLAPPANDSPSLGRSPTLSRSPMDRKLSPANFPVAEEKEKTYRRPGAGPYVNIIKERLLGMYMSVFVYKGCKHLVEGVDKSYVTAGLAGGRIGNKGGIGVSVNLAGHRLLFVNAHLAAHADKLDTRIANVAKIKQELKLDDFLEEDDPRKGFEDITDRFDTTFWCGDLNFRVDISQLHAKWLLEQKKYQDALMFDQLRKVMSDPSINPFPGFEEAPITFMPTFKYDVWKSMRATNREIKRSIRRRKTLDRPERMSTDMAGSFQTLDGVPEVDPGPTVLEEDDGQLVTSPIDIEPRPGHRIADWQSSRSSSHGHGETPLSQSVCAESVASTRPSMSSMRPAKQKSAAESYKSHYSGHSHSHSLSSVHPIGNIKEKSKKLLGMFHLGHKRTPTKSGRPVTPLSPPRRQSMISFRSSRASDDELSAFSDDDMPFRPFVEDEGGVSRRTSTSTNGSRRDRSERGERERVGRSPSGASVPPSEYTDADSFDDTIDHRIGVYDTSKKQRIPSWCDRVLWKSHVIPDEDDSDSILSYESSVDTGPFMKLSNALTNISERFRRRSSANLEYTGGPPEHRRSSANLEFSSMEPRRSSANFESPGLADGPAPLRSPTRTTNPNVEHLAPSPMESPLTVSPEATPEPTLPIPAQPPVGDQSVPPPPPAPVDLLPHPSQTQTPLAEPLVLPDQPTRPPPPMRSRENSDQLRVTIAESPTKATFTGAGTSAGTPTEQRRQSTRQRSVTFDRPGAQSGDPPVDGRVGLGVAPPRRVSRTGSGEFVGLARRGSVGSRSVRSVRSTRSTSSRTRRRSSESPSLPALLPAKTTGHMPDRTRRKSTAGFRRTDSLEPKLEPKAEKESVSAFAKFLRELPGRFHSKVNLFHNDAEEHDAPPPAERPRRHLQGEVEVLHYDTLDDAGMRQLEGRSDHRPAIFAAAVYV